MNSKSPSPSLNALEALSLEDLTKDWNNLEAPLVSIICATYQHERFIRSAISGFLAQRTSFRFEVLIRDDASTDKAPQVIKEYQDQYPGVVAAILETENRYPELKPSQVLWPLARGEFLAFCEGDDYWTDPMKLQRQVDYMRSHPEAVLTYHDFINRDELQTPSRRKNIIEPIGKTKNGPSMCTRMWRAELTENYPRELLTAPNGDMAQLHHAKKLGEVHYVSGIGPSVRRVHEGGVASSIEYSQRLQRRLDTKKAILSYERDSTLRRDIATSIANIESELLRWRARSAFPPLTLASLALRVASRITRSFRVKRILRRQPSLRRDH